MTLTDRRQLAALLEVRAKECCPHCRAGVGHDPMGLYFKPFGRHLGPTVIAPGPVCLSGELWAEIRTLRDELRWEGLGDESD